MAASAPMVPQAKGGVTRRLVYNRGEALVMFSRRAFLSASARASLAWPAAALAGSWARAAEAATPRVALPSPPPPAALPALAQRFSDLRRHFIFDFYPWYGGPPDYLHWD